MHLPDWHSPREIFHFIFRSTKRIVCSKTRSFYKALSADVPAKEGLNAHAILIDGTLFSDDEMIRSNTGQKIGRRMGHMPIDGEDGTLAALDGLTARKIFIHINNTNPILLEDSPERAAVRAAGLLVGGDGMRFEI